MVIRYNTASFNGQAMSKTLSHAEQARYGRQLLLPQFGFDGQEKLSDSTALIVGLGGLGCAAAQYLAASGIGRLVLADFDQVELSNLQRQVLHGDVDLGKNKADSAVQTLAGINPHVELLALREKITEDGAEACIADADIVLDCSDNLATRQLLNAVCYRLGKPLVSGAAIRMEGQIAVFPMSPGTPCYQCFSGHFGEQMLSCMEAGVLAPIVGIIGSMQALEAIKVLVNVGEALSGRVLLFDGTYAQWQSFQIPLRANCPVCSG